MHPHHLHLPRLPLATVLLFVVYGAALAVAVANPGRPTLAGLLVLAGLTARWAARHRRRTPAQAVVVLHRDAVPAPATAA